MNNRGPLTASGIYQVLARRGRQCGVDVYPHRFRHHFSHTWLNRGGPEGDLMELNGWSSPQMLRRYGASARSARARRTYERIRTRAHDINHDRLAHGLTFHSHAAMSRFPLRLSWTAFVGGKLEAGAPRNTAKCMSGRCGEREQGVFPHSASGRAGKGSAPFVIMPLCETKIVRASISRAEDAVLREYRSDI